MGIILLYNYMPKIDSWVSWGVIFEVWVSPAGFDYVSPHMKIAHQNTKLFLQWNF